MEMQYFKDYSPALGRDMECKIYGLRWLGQVNLMDNRQGFSPDPRSRSGDL